MMNFIMLVTGVALGTLVAWAAAIMLMFNGPFMKYYIKKTSKMSNEVAEEVLNMEFAGAKEDEEA